MKPEIDEEKLLDEVGECMELDEFGHWFNKDRARKVLKPLLDDSKQNDLWAEEVRKAEANARKAMEAQQATNAQLQEAIRQRDEARAQLICMRGAIDANYSVQAEPLPDGGSKVTMFWPKEQGEP